MRAFDAIGMAIVLMLLLLGVLLKAGVTASRRWVVHNVVAHPLLVLCPPLGEWLHDRTLPDEDDDPYPVWEHDPEPKSSAYLRREADWNRRHGADEFADMLEQYADQTNQQTDGQP